MAEASVQQFNSLQLITHDDDDDVNDDRRNIIPVFTVFKNDAIVKNIFLVLHFPPDMRNGDETDVLLEENETEQILTVGRHPNCSIVVTHPSISRFHLQIRSKPNLRKLCVTDLSSVHGTWVSGKRIRARDCIELNEGDEMRLGGSSRVYKLHWVSACQAYDLDNPFCPSSDVIMRDDVQKHEEELLLQDEAGVLSSGDLSLTLEMNTSFVSYKEELALQRPVGKDTVLKGILKHKKESSPCLVKPLSFPLTDMETMKVAEVGEIDVEKQFIFATVISKVPSGKGGTECEDHEQLSDVCNNAEGLVANQESMNSVSEEQLLAEDQTKMHVDITKEPFGINDNESGLIEITKSVMECQTPKLGSVVGEFSTTEDEESFDATLTDTCDLSDVRSEAPELDLTEGELITTENEDMFDAVLMDTRESSDAKNEAPESIHHESDVKLEDPLQYSVIETPSPQLMVNSAVRLGPRDENIAINSGNDTLVSDSGIQILEPLLNSFVFAEKDTKGSYGSMSMKCESKTQSLATPFSAKSTTDDGNQTDSKTGSNKRSNMSKLSSQRCQPLSALKILSCSGTVKKQGGTANVRSHIRNTNDDENSVCKNQFNHEEDKYEMCTPDKGNYRHNRGPLKSMKKMNILDDLDFSSSKSYSHSQNISSSRSQKATSKGCKGDLENVEYEVEMYTPDKENFTPNTRLLKSMKRAGFFDENKMKSLVSTKSHSLKLSNSSFLAEQNNGICSEKRNVDKKISISVQRKAERVPLQSLSNNSSCRSKYDSSSVNNVGTRSRGSVTRPRFQRNTSPIKSKIDFEEKVKWCMVVDSACLLDTESRKALTLLQGLRGTKLIVPRTVLRELDAMKHQASFFRRTTEVSAALKWLEDCLVHTKWWIHIQSSFEEARHLPPTPPASPKMFDRIYQDGKKSWKTFSLFRNLSDISSPKAEDHILECALQQTRSNNESQKIAILSNDTSLRIKAIAQGLICETATEFRDTLVNPFSKRFLWPESAPRGRTWSCNDDIVLRELFYSHHSANPSEGKDSVQGLKLILAYDSRDDKKPANLQRKLVVN